MKNFLVRRENHGSDLDFFDDAFDSFFKPMFFEERFNTMKTDIKEKDDKYVMDIEIPGYEKKDIGISLENGYLTVYAEKKEVTENGKKENYLRRERNSSVSRSYYVGDVEKTQIKAKYESGILSIEIPKEQPKIQSKHNIEID